MGAGAGRRPQGVERADASGAGPGASWEAVPRSHGMSVAAALFDGYSKASRISTSTVPNKEFTSPQASPHPRSQKPPLLLPSSSSILLVLYLPLGPSTVQSGTTVTGSPPADLSKGALRRLPFGLRGRPLRPRAGEGSESDGSRGAIAGVVVAAAAAATASASREGRGSSEVSVI